MNSGYPSQGLAGPYTTMGSTSAAQQSEQPRDKTLLEEHYATAEAQRDAVRDAVIRAKRIADRLLGAQPESISKEGGNIQGGSNAIAVRLGDRLNDIGLLTSQLHQELNRLERL